MYIYPSPVEPYWLGNSITGRVEPSPLSLSPKPHSLLKLERHKKWLFVRSVATHLKLRLVTLLPLPPFSFSTPSQSQSQLPTGRGLLPIFPIVRSNDEAEGVESCNDQTSSLQLKVPNLPTNLRWMWCHVKLMTLDTSKIYKAKFGTFDQEDDVWLWWSELRTSERFALIGIQKPEALVAPTDSVFCNQ